MAKTSKSTSAKAAPKKVAAKTKSPDIEKISESILEKLKALNLDAQLQSEMEWCLGSYSNDKNPIGLYETSAKALPILKEELSKKTKGITAKLIADIEKVLKG
jgi:hypothetical protein